MTLYMAIRIKSLMLKMCKATFAKCNKMSTVTCEVITWYANVHTDLQITPVIGFWKCWRSLRLIWFGCFQKSPYPKANLPSFIHYAFISLNTHCLVFSWCIAHSWLSCQVGPWPCLQPSNADVLKVFAEEAKLCWTWSTESESDCSWWSPDSLASLSN